MSTEERHIEAAEAMVAMESASAIARIRDELAGEGEEDCIECAAPIGAARKEALPSAERCIGCQTKFERRSYRGY